MAGDCGCFYNAIDGVEGKMIDSIAVELVTPLLFNRP